MDTKKRLFCVIAGILCIVGSVVVFYIGKETGILDFSLKICIGCMVAGGLVMLMAGAKKKDK